MEHRLKSKTLWLSVAALIIFILSNYGLWDAIGMNEESFKEFVDLILVVLIALGIINNPQEKGVI